LTFIEQLVTTKQQLTIELDTLNTTIKQREEQLLNRHVELELETEDKLKQKLETAKTEWREKEMKLIKISIQKTMEKEIAVIKTKQNDDIKALDTVWKDKFNTTKQDMEQRIQQKETEIRRQCIEENSVEKEREERRSDELVRQLTIDFTMKQSELSRAHEQERRTDRQQWEHAKTIETQRQHKADTERHNQLTLEWQQRLTALQEAHDADKQRYDSECERRLQRAIVEAEERLRSEVRQESEAELAHVIERLGAETVQLSKDERTKNRQAIEKLQRERTDEKMEWKDKEKTWKEKMERLNEQLRTVTKQSEKHSREWEIRWSEAEEWKQQLDRLHTQQQQTAVAAQHSHQHDNDAVDALNQQLKRSSERWKRERQQLLDEQQEERSDWQMRWEAKHSKEMSEVERRVKETVRKKDEVIDGLQKEMRRLQGQIVAMNDTIEQQKHELLSLG